MVIDHADRAAKAHILAVLVHGNALAARSKQMARATASPATAADRVRCDGAAAVLDPFGDIAPEVVYPVWRHVLWRATDVARMRCSSIAKVERNAVRSRELVPPREWPALGSLG